MLLAIGPRSPLGALYARLTGGMLPFSFQGLLLASVLYSLPFAVQPLAAAFAGGGPQAARGVVVPRRLARRAPSGA